MLTTRNIVAGLALVFFSVAVLAGCSAKMPIAGLYKQEKDVKILCSSETYPFSGCYPLIVRAGDGRLYLIGHDGKVKREITGSMKPGEDARYMTVKTVAPADLAAYLKFIKSPGYIGKNITEAFEKLGAPRYCSAYDMRLEWRGYDFPKNTQAQREAAWMCWSAAVARFYFDGGFFKLGAALYVDSNGTIVREEPSEYKEAWDKPSSISEHMRSWFNKEARHDYNVPSGFDWGRQYYHPPLKPPGPPQPVD